MGGAGHSAGGGKPTNAVAGSREEQDPTNEDTGSWGQPTPASPGSCGEESADCGAYEGWEDTGVVRSTRAVGHLRKKVGVLEKEVCHLKTQLEGMRFWQETAEGLKKTVHERNVTIEALMKDVNEFRWEKDGLIADFENKVNKKMWQLDDLKEKDDLIADLENTLTETTLELDNLRTNSEKEIERNIHERERTESLTADIFQSLRTALREAQSGYSEFVKAEGPHRILMGAIFESVQEALRDTQVKHCPPLGARPVRKTPPEPKRRRV